jgi:excisionase family DNA binding protein
MIKHDRLLRVDQVAVLLNVSTRTVRRLIEHDQFESLKVGGGLRVSLSSVEAYIQRQIAVYILNNGILSVPKDDSE